MCLCYRFTFITFISSSSNIYKYRNNIERRYAHSLSSEILKLRKVFLFLSPLALFFLFSYRLTAVILLCLRLKERRGASFSYLCAQLMDSKISHSYMLRPLLTKRTFRYLQFFTRKHSQYTARYNNLNVHYFASR